MPLNKYNYGQQLCVNVDAVVLTEQWLKLVNKIAYDHIERSYMHILRQRSG